MLRYRSALAALLCAVLLASHAAADNAWFSLNLEFNQQGDFNSGGTWTVVAKADRRGFAGVVLSFQASSLNFNPATGFLTPGEFEEEESGLFGMRFETVQGDIIGVGSPTYDIGVVGGTYPSSYVDHPGLTEMPGQPDLGSFTDGVPLVTGTFNVGDIPTWWTGSDQTDANLYTGTGFQVVAPSVFLTSRHIVPEPTSFALLAGSLLAVVTLRRN
jgi:hypothetical protein